MVALPPKPDHAPQVNDPIWHTDGEGKLSTVLVERVIAYRGDGRFAVQGQDQTHHVVRWVDEDGWVSTLSWCRFR